MTYYQALSLPFDEYMQWCRDYVKRQAGVRILNTWEEWVFIETIWARRYWFFKNGGYTL